MTDARLIDRFSPVLLAALPREEPQAPVHAEVLHQYCLSDGLLELLDWTRQGVGADPLACMWLASLRWYRLIAGQFPSGAPEPPARDADAALPKAIRNRQLRVAEGTGAVSLAGLADGEMAYPSAPAQPESDDAAALLRVVPLGLVPYIEEQMRRSWVSQAVSLTQGAPALIEAAEQLVMLVHRSASGELEDPADELEEILTRVEAPEEIAQVLRAQLQACVSGEPQPQGPAAEAVAALAQEWERVTRPA